MRAEALLLEVRVADGEHLVDEQDLGLEVRRDREREAQVHARRVALDRRVEELRRPGELDDLVEACDSISRRRMPEDGAGEVDVLAPASARGGSRCRPRAASRPARGSRAAPSSAR